MIGLLTTDRAYAGYQGVAIVDPYLQIGVLFGVRCAPLRELSDVEGLNLACLVLTHLELGILSISLTAPMVGPSLPEDLRKVQRDHLQLVHRQRRLKLLYSYGEPHRKDPKGLWRGSGALHPVLGSSYAEHDNQP